jgi:hypothetical protein
MFFARCAGNLNQALVKPFKRKDVGASAVPPDALIVYFMPYQVAPYAAGAQPVSIPYTALTGLFNAARLMPPAS